MASKGIVLNWTTIVTALLGLLGGALSGGLAAYTQLSASQEKFSIERAEMFQKLMADLQDESSARMALLNLWQLYPHERDQKIIVAAAIETGQPDLVQTIIGFDEELLKLAEILHAKALSGDPNVSDPALKTLMRVDQVRAARVMVDSIYSDVRLKGDRYIANDMILDLKRMARGEPKVVGVIRSKSDQEMPLLFDYILYDSGQESEFVERVKAAYRGKKGLGLFNDFLQNADFNIGDVPAVVASVESFITNELKTNESNRFDLIQAIIGLKNNSFTRYLEDEDNETFAINLRTAVENGKNSDLLRQKSLALLRRVSSRKAFRAIAQVLATNSASPPLKKEIESHVPGLIALLEDEDPNFEAPQHCAEASPSECVEQSEAWVKWLQTNPK